MTSGDRLTNLVLTSLAPEISSANFAPLGSNRFDVRFESRPDALLQGALTLAQLGFVTRSNDHSAVVSLQGESLSGTRGGTSSAVAGRIELGRVFIVAQEAILDATPQVNGQVALTLYAPPGSPYALEHATALGEPNASTLDSFITAIDLRTDLPPRPRTLLAEYFRATLPPTNVLNLRLEGGQVVIDWSLTCVGCALEETGQLAGAVWTPSTAQPQTINGRYRIAVAPSATARFYRLNAP